MKYGTVWQRVVAKSIDYLVLFPLGILHIWLLYLSKTAALIQVIPSTVVWYVYFIYCSGRFGQTTGMWAMNIRITKIDGSIIGWREAWLRSLINIIFGTIGVISFFVTFHYISGTLYDAADWKQKAAFFKTARYSFLAVFAWLHLVQDIWLWGDILTILLNQKRQALHDFIAGTVVIALPKKIKIIQSK
ncbi:MAG TPA: RDD family protein, partial [Phycisphaerae bacterium]|nr:RDD family protein [Phycisphaerae bacterium]